jgi:membrane associated rhomboid family serine protease
MVTVIIIVLTSATSLFAFRNQELFNKFLFNPYIIYKNKEWHRFFSHAFIHADTVHLLMNMFVLYSFGRQLENVYFSYFFGAKSILYFILLYLGGIVISSYPSFEKHKQDAYYNSVGASGAVSAIVFSGILINPNQKLIFMLFPFPMPAFIFGLLYMAYSWYMSKKGSDNIGHDAHFWGAVFGIIFTIILKPVLAIEFFEKLT